MFKCVQLDYLSPFSNASAAAAAAAAGHSAGAYCSYQPTSSSSSSSWRVPAGGRGSCSSPLFPSPSSPHDCCSTQPPANSNTGDMLSSSSSLLDLSPYYHHAAAFHADHTARADAPPPPTAQRYVRPSVCLLVYSRFGSGGCRIGQLGFLTGWRRRRPNKGPHSGNFPKTF